MSFGQSHAVGIPHAVQARVRDPEKYSPGDLLTRALTKRELQRWSDLVRYLHGETACPKETIVSWVAFMDAHLPFLTALGIIDPRAIEDILKECGAHGLLRRQTYNVASDPRQFEGTELGELLRLVRNYDLVVRLINGHGRLDIPDKKDLRFFLEKRVPLRRDRGRLYQLIHLSDYDGDREYSPSAFADQVAELGFTELPAKRRRLMFVLREDLEQSLEEFLGLAATASLCDEPDGDIAGDFTDNDGQNHAELTEEVTRIPQARQEPPEVGGKVITPQAEEVPTPAPHPPVGPPKPEPKENDGPEEEAPRDKPVEDGPKEREVQSPEIEHEAVLTEPVADEEEPERLTASQSARSSDLPPVESEDQGADASRGQDFANDPEESSEEEQLRSVCLRLHAVIHEAMHLLITEHGWPWSDLLFEDMLRPVVRLVIGGRRQGEISRALQVLKADGKLSVLQGRRSNTIWIVEEKQDGVSVRLVEEKELRRVVRDVCTPLTALEWRKQRILQVLEQTPEAANKWGATKPASPLTRHAVNLLIAREQEVIAHCDQQIEQLKQQREEALGRIADFQRRLE